MLDPGAHKPRRAWKAERVEERIVHMAGATSPEELSVSLLRRLIVEAGREPRERDTLYNPVVREAAPAGEAV